jgi:hypothetical protein
VVPKIAEYVLAQFKAGILAQKTTADGKELDTNTLEVVKLSKDLKQRINQLQFKIEGRNA